MAKPKKEGCPRPVSVRVSFMTYRIHWYSEAEWLAGPLPNDLQGQFDATAGCIHIRVQPHVCEQMLRETVLHEIMHAVCWHMALRDRPLPAAPGEEDQEEQLVSIITHGLMFVLQNNPAVMKWLMHQ